MTVWKTAKLSDGMENCKMTGKNQGILRWMISGNPLFSILKVNKIKSFKSKYQLSYANSVDLHQTAHLAASHLGLYYLPMYLLWDIRH